HENSTLACPSDAQSSLLFPFFSAAVLRRFRRVVAGAFAYPRSRGFRGCEAEQVGDRSGIDIERDGDALRVEPSGLKLEGSPVHIGHGADVGVHQAMVNEGSALHMGPPG